MNDIIVENDLIPQWLARHPFCNVCNKPVEEIEIKYNPEFKHIFGSNPKYSPGRYTTYTIRCHGEQISMDYDNIKKEMINYINI